jgi:hypothetical protein
LGGVVAGLLLAGVLELGGGVVFGLVPAGLDLVAGLDLALALDFGDGGFALALDLVLALLLVFAAVLDFAALPFTDLAFADLVFFLATMRAPSASNDSQPCRVATPDTTKS